MPKTDKYYMKKNYLFVLFMAVTSCSFLTVKREVSSAAKNNRIYYFDASTLENESVQMKEFDLNTQLTDLKNSAEQFVSHVAEIKSKKNDEQALSKTKQFVEGENQQKPYNSFDVSDKGLYLGSKKILALISEVDSKPENRDINYYQITQIARAFYQKYTKPQKDEYEILLLPITLLKLESHPKVQADNPFATQESAPEISREFVSEEGEAQIPNLYSYKGVAFESGNCVYSKAKTGYGVHAGFQIKCGDTGFKIKFGNETYSGPFNSRIYSSLGYKVPTINYSEGLHIKYDRRIFTEFNQRAVLTRKIKLVGQKVFEAGNQQKHDPFGNIRKFIMKDKSEMSVTDTKAKLLNDASGEFNSEFEKDIESVVFGPATLTLKDSDNSVELGPWQADELNYGQFKEVRALMVLSAWVGNFDVRKDNLAVYIENPKTKNAKIRMGFADAGSGLGKATFGLSKITSSEANDMVWEVSQVYKNNSDETQGKDRIELSGLMNIETNKTFENLNLSDAQWMLQKICRLPKENIKQALVASGMSSAEVVLVTEKLIFRRNKMLKDFDASKELQSQCYTPADKKINYDPNTDGLVRVTNSAGEFVTAPARGYKVQKGVLTSN